MHDFAWILELPTLLTCDFPQTTVTNYLHVIFQTGVTHPTYMWFPVWSHPPYVYVAFHRLESSTLLTCGFPQTGVIHSTYMWFSTDWSHPLYLHVTFHRLESSTLLTCDFPQTGVIHSTYMWLSTVSGITFLPWYNHPGWLGINDQVVYSGITCILLT